MTTIPIPTFTHFFRAAAVVLAVAALLSASLGVLASAVEQPLAAPSPTAGVPTAHDFFIESVPPPMPAPVVGKRSGSLVGKLGGGPVAKEA